MMIAGWRLRFQIITTLSTVSCAFFVLTGCGFLPQANGDSGSSLSTSHVTVANNTANGTTGAPSAQGRNAAKPNQPPLPSVPAAASPALPAHAMVTAPIIAQNPGLPNGCEVTSLAMLLAAVGHPVDKMTLAKEEPFDPTKLVHAADGSVKQWGNPNRGFVGYPDHRGGYSIYHGPLMQLLDAIMPGQGVDLTHHSFDEVLASVARGTPVVVWTTYTFRPTNNWVTWTSPDGPVRATFDEHAVLLVGYDNTHLYINNPLSGIKAQAVPRAAFIQAWQQLGEQAITVRDE